MSLEIAARTNDTIRRRLSLQVMFGRRSVQAGAPDSDAMRGASETTPPPNTSDPRWSAATERAGQALVCLTSANVVSDSVEKALLFAAQLLNGGASALTVVAPPVDARRPDQGEPYWPAIMATVLHRMISQRPVRHVLLTDDAEGRDCALRLGALRKITPLLGVHHLTARHAIRRAAGDTKERIYPHGAIMTLSAGSAAETETAPINLERIDAAAAAAIPSRIADLGRLAVSSDRIALSEAPLIFGAGGGVLDWDAFGEACRLFGAAPAGTRVVCDAGHLPRDRQVGASGQLASADVYVAFGISGALQHLQGIERCRRVVAINTDVHAPIVQRADMTLVADVNDVLKALHQLSVEI